MKKILILFGFLLLFQSCDKKSQDELKLEHRYCQVKFTKVLNHQNYSEFYIDNIKWDKNNYGYGGLCHIGSTIKVISDTIQISGVYIPNSSDFSLIIFNGYNDTLYKHLYTSTSNQSVIYKVN